MSMHTINNQSCTKTTLIPSSNLFVPHELGKLSVTYRGREFFVIDQNGSEKAVARMDLSQELRGISEENLEKIASVGYFAVQKVGNDYALRLNGRLEGGGPITALVVFAVVKGTGIAITVAGAATANPLLIGLGTTTLLAATPAAMVALGSGPA